MGAAEFALRAQRSDIYALATWKNVLIGSWRGADPGSVAVMTELTLELAKRYPDGVSGIHVVHADAPMPTADHRARVARGLEQLAPCIKCVAVVLEGQGFWASTLRSVFFGIRMISPQPFAFRIDSELPDAVAWLPDEHRRRTGVSLDPTELDACLKQTSAASR
jgi:hypothetical protein